MPTKLDDVIYGADKTITFTKFDIGKVLNAIAFDLEEGGKKGVQGVRIANNWTKFVAYHKARTDLKKPYLQAGVVKGSLMLVLRDASDVKLEAMDVLIKDYTKLKKKLAANTTSVHNLDRGDQVIDGSVRAVANKHNIRPDDPNHGEITGNIILDAHGTPKDLPNGRLIGTKLGKKTPQQVFEFLTSDKDPKKRVDKSYNGTLTLCGCFTASGGPEANKQDDAFAKKVLDLFRKKGYSKISVVGYPGPMGIARGDETDSHGTAMKEGDARTWGNENTAAASAKLEKLEAAMQQATDRFNAIVGPRNAAKAEKERTYKAVNDTFKTSGKTQKNFLAADPGKALYAAYQAAEKEFKKQDSLLTKADAEYKKAKKAIKDSKLEDNMAGLEGRFGLRTVN